MRSWSFYQHWLDVVSRSFALCIPQLDEPFRDHVGLAYLLFRVLDTVEDAPFREQATQQRQFERFRAFLRTMPARPVVDAFVDTFPVGLPEGELARLIFHELAHQVVYAKGDTAFNESFATTVETIGVERWLADAATPEIRAEYATYDARRVQFRALLLAYRNRLETLYASPVSDDEKRAGKRAIFASLQADYAKLKASWGGYTGYDRWFAQPLSNAHLGAVASYLEWVPAFTALYHRDGGDWARFYADVKAMARESKQQREVALRVLAPAAMAKSEGITQK